jgi:outer membrane protein assembly factor BamA
MAAMSFSCSNTKYLAKNQVLLVSSSVKLHGDLTTSERDALKNSLNSSSILLQHPNTKLLNIMRLKLWLYNQKTSEKKVGKLWNWLLIDKNMEPPVIYDSSKTKQSTQNMVSYLDNQGYFYASVRYDQKIKSKKASVSYQVNTGKSFIIDSIGFDIPDSIVRAAVLQSEPSSFLKKNDPFKIETLSQEKARLTQVIRNEGYYKFSSDEVLFVVDTINKSIFNNILDPFANIENTLDVSRGDENPKMTITVQILNPTDSTHFQRYTLRHIYVYPDYSAYATPDDSAFKQHRYKDMIIRERKNIIRPGVLYQTILLKSGNRYSQSDYNYTVQRLNNLGVWKFANIEMDTIHEAADSLDCYIFLTPGKKQEVGVNLETTTSPSDYIIGGALNLTYRNNNTSRAADRLTANLKTGIEWNSDSLRPFYSQAREYSGRVNVSFPRFITPWKIRDVGRFANASTSLGMGINYLDRLGFFSLSSINGSFGYDWNETSYKKWIVNPFAFSYNRLFNISDNFAKQLADNPFLRNSFSSTFIGGENVSFIYNSQDPLHQDHFNYFKINLEESGLLLNGVDGIIRGVTGGANNFAKLTSVGFSQYVKMDAEFKHYYNRKHATLVSRLYAGVGVPYGTSDVLPYIKQFTAGGPSSLRAWRLRALGPGSYYNPDINNPNIFPDQTGEMKLEGNLEYRFDIFKLFGGFLKVKGATFIDAGNIWDLKKNSYKPGAEFDIGRLYQDIAVGGGVGIRLDFSYAVLRFDFATPFKEPYIPTNYGWIINTIDLPNKDWRRNNIVFNLAVGYPF